MIPRIIAICTFCTLLSACSTFRSPPPVSADGFCALGLFYPDVNAEERWTPAEQSELVIRNQTTEKLCGLENTNG